MLMLMLMLMLMFMSTRMRVWHLGAQAFTADLLDAAQHLMPETPVLQASYPDVGVVVCVIG